jgi:nucleotide-binding universal stress UspA family protein
MLIALDGSDRGFETIRYVTRIPPFQDMEVVLFTVFSKIPDCYWDMEKDHIYGSRLREIRVWETNTRKTLEGHMAQARQRLIDAGFPEASVTVKIHERKTGVARDILKEARSGYTAVAVGRRGMSRVRDLVLGSITSKLLEKLSFSPLLLVGRNVHHGKVLIAMDASEGAMRAVEFVGGLLGESDLRIGLVHVVRKDGPNCITEAESDMDPVFRDAEDRLIQAGMTSKQISTTLLTGVASRAGAIVHKAREEGYGTIVVGRRGLSKVRQFFMGRVGNKVVQIARGQAVWVVA